MALTDRQQHLADAQADQQRASEALGALQAQINGLQALTQAPAAIQQQIDAAQSDYQAALTRWALAGSTGDAPSAPANLATLRAQLEEAEAKAAAAKAATAALAPRVQAAHANAQAAMQRAGAAMHELIAHEVLPGLVKAAQDARLKAHALREQLAALGVVAPEFRDLMPGLTRLSGTAMDAANNNSIALVPHGAEASRAQWRNAISGLLEGQPFQLGEAPAARFTAPPRQL